MRSEMRARRPTGRARANHGRAMCALCPSCASFAWNSQTVPLGKRRNLGTCTGAQTREDERCGPPTTGGVEVADVERLWRRFSRGDGESGGRRVGLGLALVTQMSGRTAAASRCARRQGEGRRRSALPAAAEAGRLPLSGVPASAFRHLNAAPERAPGGVCPVERQTASEVAKPLLRSLCAAGASHTRHVNWGEPGMEFRKARLKGRRRVADAARGSRAADSGGGRGLRCRDGRRQRGADLRFVGDQRGLQRRRHGTVGGTVYAKQGGH